MEALEGKKFYGSVTVSERGHSREEYGRKRRTISQHRIPDEET